jgi:hypothetical protein
MSAVARECESGLHLRSGQTAAWYFLFLVGHFFAQRGEKMTYVRVRNQSLLFAILLLNYVMPLCRSSWRMWSSAARSAIPNRSVDVTRYSDQRPIDGARWLWYASRHKAMMEMSSRST